MNIGGLQLFGRTNSPGLIVIASWHSPHSMTWRWVLYWSRFRAGERRAGWPLVYALRNNLGLDWTVMFPWLGRLELKTQAPLWYRDVWRREHDERSQRLPPDIAEKHAAWEVQEAARLRGDAPLH